MILLLTLLESCGWFYSTGRYGGGLNNQNKAAPEYLYIAVLDLLFYGLLNSWEMQCNEIIMIIKSRFKEGREPKMEKGYKTTNLISQTIIQKYDFSNLWCEI